MMTNHSISEVVLLWA